VRLFLIAERALGLLTPTAMLLSSCGGAGVSSAPPPPPPPPSIAVNVTPAAKSVPLGGTIGFSAAVTGSSDTAVTWKVNGTPGGAPATGTVDASGNYTAPRTMPASPAITITAVSHADPNSSGSSTATVTSDVVVMVSPASAAVELGAPQQFTAQVTGAGNPLATVSWRVSGSGCAGAACGSISNTGAFTAPQILSSPPTVMVTAVSDADASKTARAAVSLTSRFTLSVEGPAAIGPGAMATFSATIVPVPGSSPSIAVTWSVNGPGCGGSGTPCGSISVSGVYTAPGAPPQPDSITITATSLADPSKSASAQTQIQQTFAVTPSATTVALEQQQQFTAMLNGAATTAVQWTVDGVLAGNPTVGTISNATQLNGLYTAPVNMVAARMVTVTATSLSNPGLSASSSVSLTSNVVVQVSPPSATRVPGARQLFSATVSNTSNPSLEWRVNGVPGGDMVSGRICVVGSIPCQTPPSGLPPGSVEYEAPPAVPSPAQVTVAAVSLADNAKYGSAVVTVAAQISVNLSPPGVTLPPTGVQMFVARVVGSSDQNVTWDLNGMVNGGPTVGVLCLPASNPCQAPAGAMSGPIEYRAPAAPPSPNPVILSATSEVDSTARQMAAITIGSGPFVFSLLPASVTAGAANPFPLLVRGVQFIPSNPGPGSTVLIDGVARSTDCPSTNECSVTLDPVDVALAGNKSITIANPGSPPASSNPAALFIVPLDTTVDVITLDVSTPVATNKDIVVVEPTTAGLSPPDALTLQGIALFDPLANSCNLQAAVMTLARAINGTRMVDLCLLGTRLDTVTAINISSPSATDITLSNLNTTLGSITLRFSIAIPSTARPGPRTIFVETANRDKAAMSGGLEVK
jgi:hypothetical protein